MKPYLLIVYNEATCLFINGNQPTFICHLQPVEYKVGFVCKMQGGCVHLDQREVMCWLHLITVTLKRGGIILVVVTESSSVVSGRAWQG